MLIPVTAICVCLLSALLIKLSLNVIKIRRSERVSLGDGGNKALQKATRGQANLCEYGPIGIFLILVAELQSANLIALGVLAAAFIFGRLLHGYAFTGENTHFSPRIRGMQLTIYSMMGLIALNLITLILQLI